jgi:hypothetical protein
LSAQTWYIIGIIGFALFVVLLSLTVFVFIRLNIAEAIGFLSGRTQAKQIEQFRKTNDGSGDKTSRAGGKAAEAEMGTALLSADAEASTARLPNDAGTGTALLKAAPETGTALLKATPETGTAILAPLDESPSAGITKDPEFRLLKKNVVIHSNEKVG